MFCGNCGKPVKEGKAFCVNCGNKIESKEPAKQAYPAATIRGGSAFLPSGKNPAESAQFIYGQFLNIEQCYDEEAETAALEDADATMIAVC